jgi:capsular exopolysaccharide synthesis family protein
MNSTPMLRTPIPLERVMFDEAIQALRSAILLAPQNSGMRCLAVTSALPGDGKTVSACHLAAANARKGRTTLLIDFDLRRPMVDRCLGIESVNGMKNGRDVASHVNENWRDAREIGALPNLDVLSFAGADSGPGGLAERGIAHIVGEARHEYDLVIVDSPPILGFSTPLDIAACVDAVLLVAVAGETDLRMLGQCITALRQVGANNLSLVMNRVTASNSAGGYYGNYLKHYKRYARIA